MVQGMPAMVRTRFSTPTIGREWMIGEIGTAETSVDPDGVVRVRDALWRARTNRATPIEKGAGVRVAEIDGLVLEVEPEEGAARDYRERARSRKSAPESDHATEGTA
jgi:membrane-bound serine protease (ClpP class)